MKGIYLSPEGKQDLEAKIDELENYTYATQDIHLEGNIQGHIFCLKEILSSAIVLPIQESWEELGFKTGTFYEDDAEVLDDIYPNGVIIQP